MTAPPSGGVLGVAEVLDRAAIGADDACRARTDWSEDDVEQLVFELSWELEEAALSTRDYVTVNRAKLRVIAERVLARAALRSAAEAARAGEV